MGAAVDGDQTGAAELPPELLPLEPPEPDPEELPELDPDEPPELDPDEPPELDPDELPELDPDELPVPPSSPVLAWLPWLLPLQPRRKHKEKIASGPALRVVMPYASQRPCPHPHPALPHRNGGG